MVILHETNTHFLQIFVEINKDCPNENKQRIFIQSLLYSKSQLPSSFGFSRNLKVGAGVGMIHSGKREGFRSALIGE